jgi:hypothetical protein
MTVLLSGLETSDEIQSRRQTNPEVSFLLDRNTLHNVLEKFVVGKVAASEHEHWADTLELMDDVTYEVGHEATIGDVLFQLGAPEINRPLTVDVVRQLMDKLKG